jgi:hypothetical protein
MILQHQHARRTPFVHNIHENFSNRDECLPIRHLYQNLIFRFPAPALTQSDAGSRTDQPQCNHAISTLNACLLDPKAPSMPTLSDGDAGKFTWFFFSVRLRPFFPSLPFPLFLRQFPPLVSYSRSFLRVPWSVRLVEMIRVSSVRIHTNSCAC